MPLLDDSRWAGTRALPALSLALGLLLAFAPAVVAQEPTPAAPAEETTEPAPDAAAPAATTGVVLEGQVERAPASEAATLRFLNRDIVEFRANVLGATPEERVRQITERLRVLSEAGTVGPVASIDLGPARLVNVAGQTVFAIAVEDLDPLAGETLDEVTALAVSRLERSLQEAEELRAPGRLARSLGTAAGATVVFLLVVWIVSRVRHGLETRVNARLDRALEATVASQIADRRQRVVLLRLVDRSITVVHVALVGIAVYLWLSSVFQLFPWTRPWGEALGRSLIGTLAWILRGTLGAIPDLAIVAVIFLLTRGVTKLSALVFAAIEDERLTIPGIHPETAGPTRRLINMAVWMMALVAAYPYIPGSSTDAFKAIGVFSGLILSIGSSGVVNQIMSGFMLVYSRALKEDEFVTVGDIEGTVVQVGLLSTKLRKLNGEEITIPNALVVSRETTNHSRNENGVNLETTVTIGYDAPWRKVHSLLLEAAEKTGGLRDDPPPRVFQTALSDFYPEYRLVAKIDRPETKMPVLTELNGHIQDLFRDAEIQIMSPHYVADPDVPLIPPRDPGDPEPDPGTA